MKPRTNSIFAKTSILSTALGAAFLTLSNALAVDIFKNDTNATGLLDVNSWVGGVIPGTSDVAVWDSTVATADQSALPNVSSTTFAGIRIANPVSNVGFGVSSGKALTLGTSGIDMSAATMNLTIGGLGILRPTGSSTSSYSVASGRSLTINAQFQATSGTTTANFPGAGSVNINKLPATTTLKLNNRGSGTLTMGGSATSSIFELSASPTGSGVSGGKVIINGPTITTSTIGSYGSSSGFSSFELQSGGANFNGGIQITGGADGSLIKVTDGAFTTTTFTIGRTSNPGLGGNAPANSGFVATGGTASMTSLTVGTSNSSATARIDGSTVTVSDTINIGNGTSNIRWNTLQVNSGSLTVSGANGIQLSTHTGTANLSQVRLTGGTTTTEAINFGAAASLANSRGEVEIGSGATLYVGSGGVDIVSANAYTTNFKANGGTIGAKASWTSTVPVVLAASSTFQAADAADAAFDITLNAGVSGTGGLFKTGGGTLTLGVVAPDYSGDTTVSSGTLSLAQPNENNESSAVWIDSGALLNLNFAGTDKVEALFINGVQQLEGIYEAVGNPGSGIEISSITGTGTLTVTGSGFDTWISGTFANGNTVPSDKQGPNDDPDNDGIDNLTEYAVANLDPTVNNGSVGTFTGLTLSFAKRQPLAGDITYSIEESTDLGVSDAWAPVTPTVNDSTTISYILPGGAAKDFLRLKVVQD
jgi:autotransporter-associated beta strand protein